MSDAPDAVTHLAQAVDLLIQAVEHSKRHESIEFWGLIDRARGALRGARLEMRAAAIMAGHE